MSSTFVWINIEKRRQANKGILIIILKKLDNIDVLYSLFGIKTKRIDTLLEDSVFTNILNFVKTLSITDDKLDRFCTYTLPQWHCYIKKTHSRHNIYGTYSSCSWLSKSEFSGTLQFWTRNSFPLFYKQTLNILLIIKRLNANAFFAWFCFFLYLDDSIFQHIFKYRITDLILHNNDEDPDEIPLNIYIANVYVRTMVLY
jgi:hypothetical protein